MMYYYSVSVKKNDTLFDYGLTKSQTLQIACAKTKWNESKLKNSLGVVGECCFSHPDNISENDNLRKITKKEFDDYCKVKFTIDKETVSADGDDAPVITITYPEGGGSTRIRVLDPDEEEKHTNVVIPADGVVTIPKHLLRTTKVGITQIQVRSVKWHDPSDTGFHVSFVTE